MNDPQPDGFRVDPSDVVVLFAHLHSPILRNSGTSSPKMIEAGTVALAHAASVLEMPTIFSLVPQPEGPTAPVDGLVAYAREHNAFVQKVASPFMDGRFAIALTATGRRTLVITGYATDAVILFTGLDPLAAGFRVVVALDASGARSERVEGPALRRLEAAGAIVSSVIGVVMGCAPEFGRPPDSEAFSAVKTFLATRD